MESWIVPVAAPNGGWNPVNVTAQVKWGRRDDPFRAHVKGHIVWAWFDSSGSTTLKFARVRSGGAATCATF
jgi:hypothetical protein